MYKLLILQHKSSTNLINIPLNPTQWQEFNSVEIERRLFNLDKVIPMLEKINFRGDDYVLINILELPL